MNKNLEQFASAFHATLATKDSFEETILNSFLTGEQILEKYSHDELNKKFIAGNHGQDRPTSHCIKKKEKYFVTENSIEPFPTKDSHHGLYRHYTRLEVKTRVIENGFNITMYYATQRDSGPFSDAVHKGRELNLKFQNGKFRNATTDETFEEFTFNGFQVLKVNYSILAMKNNKIHAEYKDSEAIKIDKKSKIDMREFIIFVCDDVFKDRKNTYVLGINDNNNFEVVYYDNEIRFDHMNKIEIPDKVKKLEMTCSDHSKIKIPDHIIDLKVNKPKNFQLSQIPLGVKRLLLDEINISNFDLSKYKDLEEVLFFDSPNANLKIEKTYKRICFLRSWTIITKLPNKHFDLEIDEYVWFGYSDIFFNSNDIKNGHIKTVPLSTKDGGKTFIFDQRGRDEKKYSLQQVKQQFPIAAEWAENIGNPKHYLKKLYSMVEDMTFASHFIDEVIPSTYHGNVYDIEKKVKEFDVVLIEKNGTKKKYVVTATHYKNGTIMVVPYEKRFTHTDKDAIQITATYRMESLMDALYEVNRIPFRGWKKREVEIHVTSEKVGKEDIKKALKTVTVDNVHEVFDEIYLNFFLEHSEQKLKKGFETKAQILSKILYK